MEWVWAVVIVIGALVAAKIAVYGIFFQSEIRATMERDPAATSPLMVILSYPGLHAMFYYRVAHFFNKFHIPFLPRFISQFGRWLTGIEIHPGAQIGKGFFIDHGMGVVIGETTIIGDNVTIFQGVTLGGTGKEKGKRHPTLGNGVVVGTGACVLGNIHIGDNSNVGANAVVVRDVPANSTVVGVPGHIARKDGKKVQGINLNHTSLPDPVMQALEKLQHEIAKIEHELKEQKD
jgi:serine O-acetyltransferase